MNHKLMTGLVLASVLSRAPVAMALPAETQPAMPALTVQVTVICPENPVGQPLLAALPQALKTDGYVHGKPWSMVRLFVYAAPSVNNRKNPHGWSIAVAHTFFEPTLAAAFHLLKGKNHAAPTGPTGQLFNMLIHSWGTLTYLGVINIDHLDQKKIPLLAGNIINTFSKRWPPHGPMGPKPKSLPHLAGGRPGEIMPPPLNVGRGKP